MRLLNIVFQYPSFRKRNIIMKTLTCLFAFVLCTNAAPSPNALGNCGCSVTAGSVNPVCGTDNNDYDSVCLLQCAAKKKNDPNLTLWLNEPCNNGRKCDCPPVVNSPAVCDTNGETHENTCQYKCYKKAGAKIKHFGDCTMQESLANN